MRHDIANRAALSCEEILAILRQSGSINGPATLIAEFEENHFTLTFDYPGDELSFRPKPIDPSRFFETTDDNTALDNVMVKVSAQLLHSLTDQVKTEKRNNHSCITLGFIV